MPNNRLDHIRAGRRMSPLVRVGGTSERVLFRSVDKETTPRYRPDTVSWASRGRPILKD
jgi:hypothetical protein